MLLGIASRHDKWCKNDVELKKLSPRPCINNLPKVKKVIGQPIELHSINMPTCHLSIITLLGSQRDYKVCLKVEVYIFM